MEDRRRFVILEHDHPVLHWDLMLEHAGSLRTWRLSELPREGAVAAMVLPDHRLHYLDYEGPVSGNRGQVKRVDGGTYAVLEERPGFLRVELDGESVCGELTLSGSASDKWEARFASK